MKLGVWRLVGGFAALFAVEQIAIVGWAAAAHRVDQRDRAFSVQQIEIARGDTISFTNDDPFLHEIYVNSPRLKFESDEQPPGQTIKLTFADPGTYEVRCHIHPKMLLTVTVR